MALLILHAASASLLRKFLKFVFYVLARKGFVYICAPLASSSVVSDILQSPSSIDKPRNLLYFLFQVATGIIFSFAR